MPEPGRRQVLAVDLDGTVVGINTFPHFVRFLSGELWSSRRVVPLATLVAVGLLRKAHLRGHGDLKRVVCEVGPLVPDERLRTWAQTVLARYGHGEVLEMIGAWQGRVVLTTAAPQFYAVQLAALLGISEVHGSVVRGGRLLNNESHEKPLRLRAAQVERVDVFLTDDMVIDAPMAAMADLVYEVQPDGRVVEFPVGSAPGGGTGQYS